MVNKQLSIDSILNNEPIQLNVNLYHGDVYSSLLEIEDNSIDCVITSPPYWDQRDYGFTGQIGSEPLNEYMSKLVFIFDLLSTKLTKKGIFFLNIGDKYVAKYGNSSLGLIPYKLAFLITQYGKMILEDTIIWYKPNHMPSSVKNRFANTYEPIFVFANDTDNIYTNYKNSNEYSNILKVSLQQNSISHIAAFPEKLITELINKLELKIEAKIMDPFCGSGTLIKAIQNINANKNRNIFSYGIEAKEEYIDIMKDRCNLSKENVIKINNIIKYKFPVLDCNETAKQALSSHLKNEQNENSFENDLSCFIRFTESFKDAISCIKLSNNVKFLNSIADDGLLFIGMPQLNNALLIMLSTNNQLIIRNIIITADKNSKIYYPVIMLVKDTKLVKYKFNLDNVRSRIEKNINWNSRDFIGYKVIQSENIKKNKNEGIIVDIIKSNGKNFPETVIVRWNNAKFTLEQTINFSGPERNIKFSCPKCSSILKHYFRNRKKVFCDVCALELWSDFNSIPGLIFKEITHFDENSIDFSIYDEIKLKNSKNNYDGKYQSINKKNRGQSPGARVSIDDQYFFVSRYYKIKHGLFAHYLNIIRKKKKITIKEIAMKFPESYKHTVGHWFRTDMGGSLPKIEDLLKLNKILNLDPDYVKMISKTGIKLQTVLQNSKGKNPGDFITNKNKIDLIHLFKSLTD